MAKKKETPYLLISPELDSYMEAYAISEDDALAVWFLHAHLLTHQDEFGEVPKPTKYLTDKSNDGGIDAIYWDSNAPYPAVSIVQAKCFKSPKQTSDKYEVAKFVDIVQALTGSDEDFNDFSEGLGPRVTKKLQSARPLIQQKGFQIRCYFVTTGRLTDNAVRETNTKIRKALNALGSAGEGIDTRMVGYDGHWISNRHFDFVDGAAPAPDYIELPVEEEPYEIQDSSLPIQILAVSGGAIGDAVIKEGERLFQRNIRDDQGETKVNAQIAAQLRSPHPEHFFYLNNGITIVAERVDETKLSGDRVLTLHNPQIINGQQTSWALASHPDGAAKVKVLVRVFEIDRDSVSQAGWDDYDEMVSSIVRATNSQNSIKASDLRANDQVQVALERRMRELGIYYSRRSGASRVATTAAAGRQIIKKLDLARALQTTKDAHTLQSEGVEALFSNEKLYSSLFGKSSSVTPKKCGEFVARHHVWKSATAVARGNTDKMWARHVAVEMAWKHEFEPLVRSAAKSRHFNEAFNREFSTDSHRQIETLTRRILEAYIQAGVSHWRKSGTRGEGVEIQKFYKTLKAYSGFPTFWRSNACKTSRSKVKDARGKLAKLI